MKFRASSVNGKIIVLGVNYTFCDGYREAFHSNGSNSNRFLEGMIFSPNYDTASFGKTDVSDECELHIGTDIKGHYSSLVTFELMRESDDTNNDLCLLNMILGNKIIDGDCQAAKVQSGPDGITLLLNEQSQPSFHINV